MESTRQKKVARLVLKELSQIFNVEANNIFYIENKCTKIEFEKFLKK